ncbi:hypothetical protein [Aeromicrobium wangtongii]|uniref:Uncharacterized protein n=1 Tax=Aeromicrobium wangtongii TaxID=2969247 RepID=A0ABY5M511_9ACTN|nr:hypothetical protein [Aeromicrobium wangtongii]MCD9198036.1 hypothetical protein [Aeromicrobium wangtongii]UUP12078.1 hypothetical protein NQV15_09410 [Aeromicrobium wangtongii]
MSRLTRAMSPAALFIAVLALIVATSAGSAYAAVKIGTKQLKSNAVTSAKIKDKTIRTGDLARSTTRSLRGGTGPQGPAGPRGPGSTSFDTSLEAGGQTTVRVPFGKLYLYCSASQVFTQVDIDSADPNGLMAAGTYGINDDAPRSLSVTGAAGVPISLPAAKIWADLQISDRATGRTGTLRVQGVRTGSTCRWIGQYIP